MSLKHIVRFPDGRQNEPGIFKDADEQRIEAALKTYKAVKWSREWRVKEKAHKRNEIIGHAVIGTVGTLLASGAVAYWFEIMLGQGNAISQKLWFDANTNMRFALGQWPGLFGLFTAEAGAAWTLHGYNQGRKKKAKALAAEKVWETAKYTNDELIHVFTRENGLDPKYDSKDLYHFAGKPFPEWARPTVGKDKKPLAWSRFSREGGFNLVVGEFYERDGRFNDQPKLLKIPMSGLVTGVLVIGPTGSGKTQANLLPYIDQAVGYNFWVDSEREWWLKKVPDELEQARAKAATLTGREKAELDETIRSVEGQYLRKRAAWEKGEPEWRGEEKFAGLFWEPKSLEWRTTRQMLRKFGREKDYIELGIVPARYELYKEWTTRLEFANRELWGWADEGLVWGAASAWLQNQGNKVAVQLGKPVWFGGKIEYEEVVKAGPDAGKTLLHSFPAPPAVDMLYGCDKEQFDKETGLWNEPPKWIQSITQTTPLGAHRRQFRGAMPTVTGEHAGFTEDPEILKRFSGLQNAFRFGMMNGAPWSFPMDPSQPGLVFVGPFGFGTVSEPWIREWKGKWAKGNPNQHMDAQAVFAEPVDAIVRLFGAMGGCFEFGERIKGRQWGEEGKGDFREQRLDRGAGGFLESVRWGQQIDPYARIHKEGCPALPTWGNEPCSCQILGHGDGYEGLLRERAREDMNVLVPAVSPNASLMPGILSGNGDDVAEAKLLGQMLGFFPAGTKVDFPHVVRKQVRFLAPLSRLPNEKQTDFRVRLGYWVEHRRMWGYSFVQSLVEGFEEGKEIEGLKSMLPGRAKDLVFRGCRKGDRRGLERANDYQVARGRQALSKRMFGYFGKVYPLGWAKAVSDFFLHHPIFTTMALHDLVQFGWVLAVPGYESSSVEEQVLQWLEWTPEERAMAVGLDPSKKEDCSAVEAFDGLVYFCLRPGASLVEFGIREAKVEPAAGENPWPSINAFIRGMGAIRELQEAQVLGSLVRRAKGGQPFGRPARTAYSDVLVALAETLEGVLAREGVPSEANAAYSEVLKGSLRPEHVLPMFKALRGVGESEDGVYRHSLKVVAEDPVTQDLVDFESIQDAEGLEIALGPWDQAWSEAVGERFWPGLVDEVRECLAGAATAEVEVELRILNEAPELKADRGSVAGRNRSAQIESGYRTRAKQVLDSTLGYFRAVEHYLRSLAPYYKTDTSFAYGYDDKGGIGPCQGPNKYNPLHAPHLTPDELTGALVSVLNRTAGEGDTDAFINAAAAAARAMIGLLRAAYGYVTVATLKQMCESNGFIDLTINIAQKRLERLTQTLAGGAHQDPAESIRREVWLKCMGEIAVGRTMPASLRRFIPRAVSNTELNEIRELLASGITFVQEHWRNEKGGMFASVEMRGSAMSTLFSRLESLAMGIGEYAFSPAAEDEISFPTWWEIRTEGKVAVYRLDHFANPITSNLVSGMAITGYQAMVLGTPGKRGESAENSTKFQQVGPRNREELKRLRQEMREVSRVLWKVPANDAKVEEVLSEAHKEFQQVPDPIQKARAVWGRLLQAEKEGTLKGALLGFHRSKIEEGGRNIKTTSGRLAAALKPQGGESEDYFRENIIRLFQEEMNRREEVDAAAREKAARIKAQSWRILQDMKNLSSAIEDAPNLSRYCFLIIDEYQTIKNMQKAKAQGISDEIFLSAARAGGSVNIFCTQALSSVMAGVSKENFNQWLSNLRTQVCLGAPNADDQKLLSEMWGGERKLVEQGVQMSLSYDQGDMGVGGEVRGSALGGVNRTIDAKRDLVKWVEPEQLILPSMRSWVKWVDGNIEYEPHMVCHTPYFLLTSDKISEVTGEPVAQKTFAALIRDGEFNLRTIMDLTNREAALNLASLGLSEDEEEDEKKKK